MCRMTSCHEFIIMRANTTPLVTYVDIKYIEAFGDSAKPSKLPCLPDRSKTYVYAIQRFSSIQHV